jgi:hypothetical protein
MDQTMGIIFLAFIVVVPVLSTFLGAESRTGLRQPERKPEFRISGSMKPEDWPPSEFER